MSLIKSQLPWHSKVTSLGIQMQSGFSTYTFYGNNLF